jgi:hypothetical protein
MPQLCCSCHCCRAAACCSSFFARLLVATRPRLLCGWQEMGLAARASSSAGVRCLRLPRAPPTAPAAAGGRHDAGAERLNKGRAAGRCNPLGTQYVPRKGRARDEPLLWASRRVPARACEKRDLRATCARPTGRANYKRARGTRAQQQQPGVTDGTRTTCMVRGWCAGQDGQGLNKTRDKSVARALGPDVGNAPSSTSRLGNRAHALPGLPERRGARGARLRGWTALREPRPRSTATLTTRCR